MLSSLNRYLPKSILNRFKEPLAYFIRQQQYDLKTQIEQLQSVLEIRGLVTPLAPSHLQVRVSGGFDGNFFRNGCSQVSDLENALKSVGKQFDDFNMILDFGVGCGRTLIPLSLSISSKKIFGTDIDNEAISWLNDNYKEFGGFSCNPHYPPMAYENDFFDLVFSISIFTHLPEDMQFAWLEELSRITKSGGYLLLSFHGDYCTAKTPQDVQLEVNKKGFSYVLNSKLVDGLPDFYKNTFHSTTYIKKEWGRFFEVVNIIPQGIGNNQDLAILRKR